MDFSLLFSLLRKLCAVVKRGAVDLISEQGQKCRMSAVRLFVNYLTSSEIFTLHRCARPSFPPNPMNFGVENKFDTSFGGAGRISFCSAETAIRTSYTRIKCVYGSFFWCGGGGGPVMFQLCHFPPRIRRSSRPLPLAPLFRRWPRSLSPLTA